MGLTLYVGADESNHGGKKGGEIIVATFSSLDEDGEISNHGNRRDFSGALNYVSGGERDWNFTVRFDKFYKHRGQNLSFVLPTLVNHYLKNFQREISKICVYLDGEIKSLHKNRLFEDLFSLSEAKNLERVSISAFTKKRVLRGKQIAKRYGCPKLVWVADSLANGLNRLQYEERSMEELLGHRKMVVPLIAA